MISWADSPARTPRNAWNQGIWPWPLLVNGRQPLRILPDSAERAARQELLSRVTRAYKELGGIE